MKFSFFEVPYMTYPFLLKLISQMWPPLPLTLALSSVLTEFLLCSFLILQSADFKALPGHTLIYSLPQQIYTDGCLYLFSRVHICSLVLKPKELWLCVSNYLCDISVKCVLYNLNLTKAKLDKFYSASKKFTIPNVTIYDYITTHILIFYQLILNSLHYHSPYFKSWCFFFFFHNNPGKHMYTSNHKL